MEIDKVKITERGWAGHYICADNCKFRRNTLLEYKDKKWVVSTVGAMPANKYTIDKNKYGFTQIGCDRYYETMVFEARKQSIYYEADVSKEIDFESKWCINDCNFETDQEANDMHENVVKELIEKIKKEQDNG